jgi:hypothetical protein
MTIELVPEPRAFVSRAGVPETTAAWRKLPNELLTDQTCIFHRNIEISSRYAWIYKHLPTCFKWAGMAAFASHHARLALFPFRRDVGRDGHVDISGSLRRHRALPMSDVNTIRKTNNAIFADIFWVHLAYATADDGIGRLRELIGGNEHYAPIFAAFESIDRGRKMVEAPAATAEARRAGEELIWTGNIEILEHEQFAVVQPNFDRLSCAFARLFSMGSSLNFEVHGMRDQSRFFTSFYLYAMTRRLPPAVAARSWPRVTRFDDRWRWILASIVPRSRRFESDPALVDRSLNGIFDEARGYVLNPCVVPQAGEQPAPA